jgi:SAM-dependent methyltransferase
MSRMVKREIGTHDRLLINSDKFPILPERRYRLSVPIAGITGTPYSLYIAVIVLDSHDKELARRVRWVKSLDGEKRNYTIVLNTPARSAAAIIACRGNVETPVKGEITVLLPAEFSPRMITLVADSEKESWDYLSEYIYPIFLTRIARSIDEGKFPSRGIGLEVAVNWIDSHHRRDTWAKGVDDEVSHWRNYLLFVKNDAKERFRLDPRLPIAAEMVEHINTAQDHLAILDVGAGPLTGVGKALPGCTISVTAIDPLAPAYDRALEELDIIPPVRTLYGEAERLTEQFIRDQFDFILCANALDHCYNPLRAIEQMLAVLKRHCTIMLRHFSNEAEKEGYSGFHQWNLWSYKGNFIIWNREEFYLINDLLEGQATISISEDADLVLVTLQKL